jgi:TonB family protein
MVRASWMVLAALVAAQPGVAQDRYCGNSTAPPGLSQLSDLLDADALRQLIGGLDVGGGRPAVLLTIGFDWRGQVQRVDVLETDAPDSTAAALATGMRAALRSQRGGDPWGVRMRLFLGDDPELALESAPFCPLAVRESGRSAPQRTFYYSDAAGLAEGLDRPGPMEVRVLVDTKGNVKQVQVERSSGVPRSDEWAAGEARRLKFHPAVLDGQPVEAWYEIRWRGAGDD